MDIWDFLSETSNDTNDNSIFIDSRLKEDVDKLVKIAHEKGVLSSVTIMHLLNEKCLIDEYDNVVNYLQKKYITVIEDEKEEWHEGKNSNILDSNKINIQQKPLSVEGILKRIKYKEINMDTDFQRKRSLWDISTKSQLIESLMLRIPIPPFYFDATKEESWLIIDGLQRLSTLKEFIIDNSFNLEGMEYFKDYNGCSYEQLPRTYIRRIEETQLTLYLLMPGTPYNIKYSLFKRINTPGLKLESQEIRHALYQGKSTRFLEKLAESEIFIDAINHSIPSDRMLDREFILRYIAFNYLGVEKYKECNAEIDTFLNSAMEYLNDCTIDELDHIEVVFYRSLKCAKKVFGKYAFRRINGVKPSKLNPINVALFESWLIGFSRLSEKEINIVIDRRDKLIEIFVESLSETYGKDINTAKTKSVKRRIDTVKDILSEVLAYD